MEVFNIDTDMTHGEILETYIMEEDVVKVEVYEIKKNYYNVKLWRA